MAMSDDILSEAIAELLREGLDATSVTCAIARVRQRWGGEKVYIRAVDRAARDDLIRAAINDGRPTDEIAKRARVSAATVRRRKSTWFNQ